ncbi:DUF1648 domain-containing protein [Deinococcus daejeonensis]|uniref:DUF1648 domain-containing protein n=1 Tax=Deinococcus daejeonensis TaxID=1007098 RepID=A0ABQ2JHW5_9DEIO|nr:DUF1648 domain-containing protein [Deinococcus daejeonensis]GGN46202.1 hypothetical protein GCM10010842_36520 [Deinococcus daejeonensis]
MRPWLALLPFPLTFALAAWSLPQQPARLPTHWGVDGQPDAWGSAAQALFQLPILMLPAALLLLYLGQVPSQRRNAPLLQLVALGLGLLALTQTAALAFEWNTIRALLVGLGLLFTLIGNVMGRAHPSAFVGLRTPWVYLSRRAWHASQRRSGVWFVGLGMGLLLAALLAPTAWLTPWVAPYALLAAVALMLGVLTYASYRDWKTDPEPQPVQL